MTYEEHEKLVYQAIYSKFKSHPTAERVANLHNMDFDDFVQIGRIALLNAIRNYEEDGRASFAHYAITYIQLNIQTELSRRGAVIRIPEGKENPYTFESIDKKQFETGRKRTIGEILPSSTNVERYVLRKMELHEKLEMLKPEQKKVIQMKLSGYTERDIAESLGKSVNAVQMIAVRALNRIDPNRQKTIRHLGKEFASLYEQGLSKEEIIKRLEITPAAYRNYKYSYNKNRRVS